MGYGISQGETQFCIRRENVEAFKNARKKFINAHRNSWCIDSWEFAFGIHGDIIGVEFVGEKLSDDYEMFCAIQEFVFEGSFITIHGEDGDIWRWIYRDGKCGEIHATFSFNE